MIEFPVFPFAPGDWVEGKKLLGKNLAALIRQDLKGRVTADFRPGLGVILVGQDPASEVYVGNKEKAAAETGFHSEVRRLSADAGEKEILNIIEDWNASAKIHGILVQLPLPAHLRDREQKILEAIEPQKDADGFHYYNMGRTFANEEATVACTPLGIMVMLKHAGIEMKGRHAVVVGRSNIVGRPMAALLLSADCTVTVCHSRSRDIDAIIRTADIVVAATGVKGAFREESIPDGAVVVDVGMHRDEAGKLSGDLDPAKFRERCLYYTPVPGGVGPLTIAMLLYNTLKNAERLRRS